MSQAAITTAVWHYAPGCIKGRGACVHRELCGWMPRTQATGFKVPCFGVHVLQRYKHL